MGFVPHQQWNVLLGEGVPQLERLDDVRKNNVEFYQNRSPDGPPDFRSQQILTVRASRNIDFREPLYCDYGNYYNYYT